MVATGLARGPARVVYRRLRVIARCTCGDAVHNVAVITGLVVSSSVFAGVASGIPWSPSAFFGPARAALRLSDVAVTSCVALVRPAIFGLQAPDEHQEVVRLLSRMLHGSRAGCDGERSAQVALLTARTCPRA